MKARQYSSSNEKIGMPQNLQAHFDSLSQKLEPTTFSKQYYTNPRHIKLDANGQPIGRYQLVAEEPVNFYGNVRSYNTTLTQRTRQAAIDSINSTLKAEELRSDMRGLRDKLKTQEDESRKAYQVPPSQASQVHGLRNFQKIT